MHQNTLLKYILYLLGHRRQSQFEPPVVSWSTWLFFGFDI